MTSTGIATADAARLSTGGRHARDYLFVAFGVLSTLMGLIALGALLYDVIHDGAGRLSWSFLMSFPSRIPSQAGIFPALVGSIYVIALTAAIAVPLGVAAALHLEEYGGRGRLSRLIEINIANLAGVPSIIYGLLGLGLFVRIMGMGRSVLAGASYPRTPRPPGRHPLHA